MSSYFPFAVCGVPYYYPPRSTGELAADPVLTDATSSNLFIEDGLPNLGPEKTEDDIGCDAESQAISPKLYRLPSDNSDFSLVSGNQELIAFNDLQLEREIDWQKLEFPVNPSKSYGRRRSDRSRTHLGRPFAYGRPRHLCFEANPDSSSPPTLPPDLQEVTELQSADEGCFDSGLSSLHLTPNGTDRSYHSPSSSLSLSTDSMVYGGYGSDDIAYLDNNSEAGGCNLVELNCRTGFSRDSDTDPWLADHRLESESACRSADLVLLQQRQPLMPVQRRALHWPSTHTDVSNVVPSTSVPPSASRRKQPILYPGAGVSPVAWNDDRSLLVLTSKRPQQVTTQRVDRRPVMRRQTPPEDLAVGGCASDFCKSCLEDRTALYERLTEGSVTRPSESFAFSNTSSSSITVSPSSFSPASSPPSSASSSTSSVTLGIPFGPVCRALTRPLQSCPESYCWSRPPTATRTRKACLRGLSSVDDCSLVSFGQTDSSSDYEIEADNRPLSRRPMRPTGGHPLKRTPSRSNIPTPSPPPPHGPGGLLSRRRTIGFPNGERPYNQEYARSHYNQYMRSRARGRGRRRHLLSFILDLLAHRHNCVEWVNKTDRVFQIVNPEQLTRLWGEYKNNKKMSFESLSRSLRLYYAPGKLERISGLRHHYRLLYSSAPVNSEVEGLCHLSPHRPAPHKHRPDRRHDNGAEEEQT
ncbi:erythroblast transformation specific domain [Sparganum proliferum]